MSRKDKNINKKSIKDESEILWLFPKVNVLLRRKMQKELSQYELLWEQWSILSKIYRNEGVNQKKIAEISIKNEAAVTRTLNYLEGKNLVSREKSEKDKREYLIYLTENGRKIYEESEEVYFKILNDINNIFKKEELKNLKKSLNKLIDNLH
ncbi:MarR family winged helix-turn-helix transcriptional regulator [Methanobrevibacter curvatus]|uniref:Multidrug resistance operon repressor n=1 Tax=Methanobrevibacter curvatus TaxID=49547 RepID=A0A166DUX9_9EURY|nr:MarR family transcriptional regulator [Methanobrevibacter curvatus]KZX15976.1 multidrug resistance operon repressor [Methanobrevibacter curvatus]